MSDFGDLNHSSLLHLEIARWHKRMIRSNRWGVSKLVGFRVQNFRSINDSGDIKAEKLTSFVGRNESGKSNILLALHSLNPAGGRQDLSPIKNFPRGRRLRECTDDTRVIDTTWQLDASEQSELARIFPRAVGIQQVVISRPYKAILWVTFPKLKAIEFSVRDVAARLRKLSPQRWPRRKNSKKT